MPAEDRMQSFFSKDPKQREQQFKELAREHEMMVLIQRCRNGEFDEKPLQEKSKSL